MKIWCDTCDQFKPFKIDNDAYPSREPDNEILFSISCAVCESEALLMKTDEQGIHEILQVIDA